jgi:hypothetical protein
MVTLQSDQELYMPCDYQYLVCQGGDYEETTLIPVYRRGDIDKIPWVAFHAGYIVCGNDYYSTIYYTGEIT